MIYKWLLFESILIGRLVGNNIQVLTCVHDSRQTGGGVTGVSLQIHQDLVRKGYEHTCLAVLILLFFCPHSLM